MIFNAILWIAGAALLTFMALMMTPVTIVWIVAMAVVGVGLCLYQIAHEAFFAHAKPVVVTGVTVERKSAR